MAWSPGLSQECTVNSETCLEKEKGVACALVLIESFLCAEVPAAGPSTHKCNNNAAKRCWNEFVVGH